MITIHERLSRIETQNMEQSKVLDEIKKLLHGNGRRGICQEVELNRQSLNEILNWRIKHEKNIKWWMLFIVGTTFSLIELMRIFV